MVLNKKIKNRESEWFEKGNSSQEVHIPIEIAGNIKLKHDEKIAVKMKCKNLLYKFPSRIRIKLDEYRTYFRFQIPKQIQDSLSGKLQVKIIKLNKPCKINLEEYEIDSSRFCNNPSDIVEWLDSESIVLWNHMKQPLIITRKINALSFAKYLGLYYADGSKTSHYVCSCSTKKIAELVLTCYGYIIKNPRYSISIEYKKLNSESNRSIINRITNYWSDLVFITQHSIKIKGEKKTFRWSNEFGILRLDDSRKLSLDLHKWLIKEVLKLGNKNNEVLEEFLKGGLLGDGLVSNRRKGTFQHIAISSNNQEYYVWESICKKLGLNYYVKKDKKVNSVYVRFGDYYKSILFYKKGVFAEYKKRRERLFTGLKNRVETYILQQLLNHNFKLLLIKGKFGSRTPSFFYVNKGGDLVKNSLVSLEGKSVTITDKGKEFIKALINLKIVEVD